MRVTQVENNPRAMRALPDGEYSTNNISPIYFKKEDGMLVFKNGAEKTIEEFVGRYRSVVGPLISGPLYQCPECNVCGDEDGVCQNCNEGDMQEVN